MASIVATPAQQPGTGSGQQQIKKHSAVTKVHIRDGKTIKVNDHVYISAPWAPGAGEPYLIARVMEFVTASSARAGAAALASSSGTLQVRANLYLRVRDVSHRVTNDPRLLLATMHSDLFALDNVRGLCEVRHRELIGDGSAPDITAWKRRDDHFYFHQLYDRYIHRFYDVIPMSKIKNAPADVLLALNARYSFVVAEVGMAADLCDALRGCAVCHQWAPSADSVRCDTCKTYYHMRCLNPPLLVKPSKGYSWSCASCSKKHEEDVGVYANGGALPQNSLAPGTITEIDPEKEKERERLEAAERKKGSKPSVKPPPQPRGRNSSRRRGDRDGLNLDGSMTPNGSPGPEKPLDDIRGTRCFNNWPYRYFGQHTAAPDVLDPHDSIYPRATTRLGPKFQAGLPSWEEQQAIGVGTSVAAWGKRSEMEKEANEAAGEAAKDSVMQDGSASASKAATPVPETTKPAETITNGNGNGVGTAGGSEGERSEGDPSRAASPSSVTHSRSATTEPTSAPDATTVTSTPTKNGTGEPISSVEGRARELTAGEERSSSAPPSRENTPIPGTVKKGRGRPRKHPPSTTTKNSANEEAAAAAPDGGSKEDALEAEPEEEINRGSDETIDVIWAPLDSVNDVLINAYLSGIRSHFSSVPGSHVDLIDRALEILYKHKGDAVQALMEASTSDLEKGFLLTEWNAKEKRIFESAIKEFSAEMKSLKKRIPTRTPAEIVRYFAHWKNGKLAQQISLEAGEGEVEEEETSAPEEEDKTSTKEKGKRRAPARVRVTSSSRAVSPAMSIFPPDPPRSKPRVCQMCSTSSSSFWYKGPFAWQNRSLCSSCGLYWRKYAAESSIAESIVASHKRQAAAMAAAEEKELGVAPPPVKMLKSNKETKVPQTQPTTVTEKTATPTKCLFCRRLQPIKKLEQCTQCTMSAHQGCYGITEEDLSIEGGWQCDACANEKTLDAALVPRCVLCPKEKEPEEDEQQAKKADRLLNGELPPDASDRPHGNSLQARRIKQGKYGTDAKTTIDQQYSRSIPGISALEAFKATECNNWAHLVCALWTPGVSFVDSKKMSLVEGIGNLPQETHEAYCDICDKKNGSCITCCEASCDRTFHVACAWAQQPAYVFGFEVKPVDKAKKATNTETIVTFKGETGVMSALAWCKKHKEASKSRKLFDMGESDPKSGLTTVQTYSRNYKKVRASGGIPGNKAYNLLRRARRFDRELIAKADPEQEHPRPWPFPLPESHWLMRCSPEIPSDAVVDALVEGPWKRECVECHTQSSPIWWELDENNVVITDPSLDQDEDEEEILNRIDNQLQTVSKPFSKSLDVLQRFDEYDARVCCNRCRPQFEADSQPQSPPHHHQQQSKSNWLGDLIHPDPQPPFSFKSSTSSATGDSGSNNPNSTDPSVDRMEEDEVMVNGHGEPSNGVSSTSSSSSVQVPQTQVEAPVFQTQNSSKADHSSNMDLGVAEDRSLEGFQFDDQRQHQFDHGEGSRSMDLDQ